jgi:hypothetical protein
MPALANPRWERFAQAIVEGLANGDRKPYSQGRAYIAAGYTAKDQGKRGGSAECAASRLLNRVKPILERVRELQAIAARNAAETAEKMARELNEIQYEARADKAHAAAVSAVLGKARILNIIPEDRFRTSQLNARHRAQIAAIRWLQRTRRCFDPGCHRLERQVH